jgi:predicted metallo-beta-lactamase superfamily hydrolase
VKIIPLAAESLGVRSMATYVEAGQNRILIDPGAALGPRRYNLPPADEEWEALRRANDRIAGYAIRAHVVFISHYHHDHFQYGPDVYQGRVVWAKDPGRAIKGSQAQRAKDFWAGIRAHCRLESAEGKYYEFPDALLKASPALPHGADGSGFGYVVALTVTDRAEGFRFVFASDVQGPLSPVATAYLIRERPHLLYLAGPPSYLQREIGARALEQGIANLLTIIEKTGCQVIMDHHALRDLHHEERLARLWETGKVVSAAKHLGVPEQLLEARRNFLWGKKRTAGPVEKREGLGYSGRDLNRERGKNPDG